MRKGDANIPAQIPARCNWSYIPGYKYFILGCSDIYNCCIQAYIAVPFSTEII